jgi:hypothetical protein
MAGYHFLWNGMGFFAVKRFTEVIIKRSLPLA